MRFGECKKALGYAVYDRLPGRLEFRERLLVSNSIKHNGVVSQDLANELPITAQLWDKSGCLVDSFRVSRWRHSRPDASQLELRDAVIEC